MIQEKDGRLIIDGPMTMQTVAGLLESGRALCSEKRTSQGWVVDFSRVTAVDSAALALVLDWMRAAKGCGHLLRFVGVPASLHALIALYDLGDILVLEDAA